MNIAPSSIHLRKVLADGRRALDRSHRDREQSRTGLLRAGSAGVLVAGGVLGGCARLAHARHLGHDKPVDPSRKLMFEAGEGNEDLVERVLAPAWEGQVLRGQQVQKQGSWGTVSGSPDIVLADAEGQWQTILELKLVSSLNTAVARGVEGEPDSSHLVQCAVYSWMAEVPVILVYVNRADFAVQFQAKKLGIKKVEPFYRLFYTSWRDGVLWYRDEFAATEVSTLITVDGLRAYYQELHDMAQEHRLSVRPSSYSVTGAPLPYDRCNYCPLQEACDSWEHDYQTWRAEVARLCASDVG